jgi:hypothetical protein
MYINDANSKHKKEIMEEVNPEAQNPSIAANS